MITFIYCSDDMHLLCCKEVGPVTM